MVGKKLKILGTVTLSLLLVACGGNPPNMERPIEVWNGSPENGGICRINAAVLSRRLNIPEHILAPILAEGVDCIPANDERFKEFGCMTFEDMGVIRRWEETLLDRCEKWKP